MKNEFPKRIIRVSGCHACPYVGTRARESTNWSQAELYCRKTLKLVIVNTDNKTKTLPDNCPLEKVVQVITEAKE